MNLHTLLRQIWVSTWLAITDDEAAVEASKQEIIRRYYQTVLDFKAEKVGEAAVKKIELLMNDLGITPADRKVAVAARQKQKKLVDQPYPLNCQVGKSSQVRTQNSLVPTAAALINAIKKSADIAKEVKLIEPEVVKPIQGLKSIIWVAAIHAFIQMKPDCTCYHSYRKS